MSQKHPLEKFRPVADTIPLLLGSHTEVVIHDLATDSIYHVANPFSGRNQGDDSYLRLPPGSDPFTTDVIGPYEKAGEHGHQVSSITAVLRDDHNSPIGLLCINVDNSQHLAALATLRELVAPSNVTKKPEVLFRNDWQSQIKEEINDFLAKEELSAASLTPRHRRNLIAVLEGKGLFYAKKSIEQLTSLLGVSRATLYKDLAEIRKLDPTQVLL